MNIFDHFIQLNRTILEKDLTQAMKCFPWRPSVMGDRLCDAFVALLALSVMDKKGLCSEKNFRRNLAAIARTMYDAADVIQERDGAASPELPQKLRKGVTIINNLLRPS